MAATAQGLAVARREPGALARLLDNKLFLIFLCMLPAAGLLIVFLSYPLGLGIWLAFTDTRIGRSGQFIGLENYISLLQDRIFLMAVGNTLLYTGVATVGKFALGLWLALLLNKHSPAAAGSGPGCCCRGSCRPPSAASPG